MEAPPGVGTFLKLIDVTKMPLQIYLFHLSVQYHRKYMRILCNMNTAKNHEVQLLTVLRRMPSIRNITIN